MPTLARFLDLRRGRRMATRAFPDKRLVKGYVWHDAPGEPFRYVEDPMQDEPGATRVSYKALLQRLIDACEGDDLEALKSAYRNAQQAIA